MALGKETVSKLLMSDYVSKPTQGRCKVCVILHVEPIVSFLGVFISSIDCQFLNLNSSHHKCLFEFVLNSLFLKKFLNLIFKTNYAVIFKSDSKIRKKSVKVIYAVIRRLRMIDNESIRSIVSD